MREAVLWTLASLIASLAGSVWLRQTALARHWVDEPNARSSHRVPTPRGGGLAIAATFLGALSVWAGASDARHMDGPVAQLWLALAPAGALVAAVGFLDDRRSLPIGLRLLAYLGACLWMVLQLEGFSRLLPDAPPGVLALGTAALAGLVVASLWSVNLYNFMDGIDGIAATQAVFVCLAAAWLTGPQALVFPLLLALAGASAGFVLLNWAPARLFMGDSGSTFLGLTLAGLLLALHLEGRLPLAAAVILMGVFVTDATWTLLTRWAGGQRVLQAHRSHAYQHAATRLASHATASSAVALINVGWLLPWAALACAYPAGSPVWVLVALAPLAALARFLGAGKQ